jgi:hypothetical protein
MPRGYPDFMYYALHQVGEGYQMTLDQPAPGVGAGIEVDVPGDAYWLIKFLKTTLTTAAGGANRQISLRVKNPGLTIFWVRASVAQVPGETCTYFFGPFNYNIGRIANEIYTPIPGNLTVTAGGVIYIQDTQAGDQFSDLEYTVQEVIIE